MKPLVVALALALLAPAAAHAASPTGEWRSSSGSTILIPPTDGGPSFDLVVASTTGAANLYVATWVAGLEGTQFRYVSADYSTYTGTFDSRSGGTSIRLASQYGDKSYTWTRQGPLDDSSTSGRWSSSSGARFSVIPGPRGAGWFYVAGTSSTGARTLGVARWSPGLEGTQFTYVMNYATHTATLNARTRSTIVVAGVSTPTTWTRLDPAPRRPRGGRDDLGGRGGDRRWSHAD